MFDGLFVVLVIAALARLIRGAHDSGTLPGQGRGPARLSGDCRRLPVRDEAAVDGEVGSGDVRGAVAGQNEHEIGDLTRPTEAACRHLGQSQRCCCSP